MPRQIHVGNLSFDTTAESLRELFARSGYVVSQVTLVTAPGTGRPRGFGFVELESEEAAAAAIQALNGAQLDGRAVRLGEGHPRPEPQIRAAVPERTGRRRS